ncbi:MAG: YgiT-type zinc finger protein [[Eubacterium] siraeum]
MTCLFCKGNMVNSTTTFTAELEHGIVIVKNVPCFKCDQCGEESFPFEVTVRLENH